MRKNIYLLLLISVVISLFFLPSAFAEENNAETNFNIEENLEYNISLEENQIEEDSGDMSDFYKYQDVFYPPEEELAKQGMTLESYKQALKRNASKSRNLYSSVDNIWGTCPTTGLIKIPVLLVQFDGRLGTTPHTMNNNFNNPTIGSNFISVSKYYNMQSYGALDINFVVYDWQTMPQSFAYYADGNNYQLIVDAITSFDINANVDFAQFDNDGDGRLDGIVIVYAGTKGTPPSGIYPNTRILNQFNVPMVDGKYYGNTALIAEKRSTYFETIVATHEFAHVLGLPDLYPVPRISSDLGPLRDMSMMVYSGDNIVNCLKKPINLDVWSRYFLGWINPTTLTTSDNKNQSLRSVNDYSDAIILRNDNLNDREFFIIENRYRQNITNNLDICMFANAPTGGGLAIYHVDENKIEAHYPNLNYNINWDPDGNYYDDTTWPGITYEKNYIANLNNFEITPIDFYYIYPTWSYHNLFDENRHPEGGAVWDMTTRSYSGNLNPLIRFQATSTVNQLVMSAIISIADDTTIPTIDQNEGTYLQGTEFIISTTTPESNIYYTIDGNIPNFSSQTIESGSPIILPVGTITLKAMAKGEDHYASEVVSRTYTIIGTVANPQATPESGVVDYNSTVILSTSTEDAEIRYTTDFTVPTEESPLYSSPIIIIQDTNLNVRAFKTGYNPSETINYYYSVAPVATPVASHPGGEILFRTPVTLSTTTPDAIIRYTLDGTEPNNTSSIYTRSISIRQPLTLKAKTFRDGQQPSETAIYSYQVKLLTPRVNIESGIYQFTTKIKLTSEVPGTQIYYTTDGTDPNDGQLYNTHFRLLEDMHLRAIVKRTGYIDSEIIDKTYTVSNQEQSVPKLLIDPRTPRGYENFDLIYITERHWADDLNFTITNLNSCTFNLRPIIYNDGHYTYYVFENNRCIRRIQTRLTLTVRDQNGEERADAELIILDSGLQAIAVGRE